MSIKTGTFPVRAAALRSGDWFVTKHESMSQVIKVTRRGTHVIVDTPEGNEIMLSGQAVFVVQF